MSGASDQSAEINLLRRFFAKVAIKYAFGGDDDRLIDHDLFNEILELRMASDADFAETWASMQAEQKQQDAAAELAARRRAISEKWDEAEKLVGSLLPNRNHDKEPNIRAISDHEGVRYVVE